MWISPGTTLGLHFHPLLKNIPFKCQDHIFYTFLSLKSLATIPDGLPPSPEACESLSNCPIFHALRAHKHRAAVRYINPQNLPIVSTLSIENSGSEHLSTEIIAVPFCNDFKANWL